MNELASVKRIGLTGTLPERVACTDVETLFRSADGAYYLGSDRQSMRPLTRAQAMAWCDANNEWARTR